MFRRFFGPEKEVISQEGGVHNPLKKLELPESEVKRIASLHTDADFLRSHFELMDRHAGESERVSHVPILETTFTEKSSAAYSGPWMARELIQNWLDAEVTDEKGKVVKRKYTLDGVTFKEETSPDESVTFTISGGWALTNLDGLVGLSSDKPGENNAGGNGIGLKQAALGLLRGGAHQAESFDVYATSSHNDHPVKISYNIVTPEDVVEDYSSRGTTPIRGIKKPWLVGEIRDMDALTVAQDLPEHRKSKDACAYVISTRDASTIEMLRHMKDYGVHSENPYLKNPDFESPTSSCKWMSSRTEEGKLFVNGQIMDYDKKSTPEDVFPGPTGLTARFDNVKYPMSIDRAPLSWIQLREYFEKEFSTLKLEGLMDQLHKSKGLWEVKSTDPDVDDGFRQESYKGYYVAIEKIVERLSRLTIGEGMHRRNVFTPEAFVAEFGDRYVHASYSTSKEDILAAEALGYTVCLPSLKELGVKHIKEVIDSSAKLKSDRPDNSTETGDVYRFKKTARIYFKKFESKESGALLREFEESLEGIPYSIQTKGGEVTIIIGIKADEAAITDDLAEVADTDVDRVLYACRGLIARGQSVGLILEETPYMVVDGRQINIDYVESEQSKTGHILSAKVPDFDSVNQALRDSIALSFEVPQDEVPKWSGVQTEALAVQKKIVTANTENSGLQVASATPERKEFQEYVDNLSHEINPDTREVVVRGESYVSPVIHTEEAREVFNLVKKQMPEIDDVIIRLEDIANTLQMEDHLTGRERLVLDWFRSNGHRLTEGSDAESSTELYIRPETLVLGLGDLLERYNAADIDSITAMPGDKKTYEDTLKAFELKSFGGRISDVADKFIPDAKHLENFELITEPSIEQLRKLSLLKSTMHAFGYSVPNELFVFKGQNVKGFNLVQRAIGLHEELFKEEINFGEAFAVFRHEIAHNRTMDHNAEFIATDEAIASHVIEMTQKAANIVLEKQASLVRRGLSQSEIDETIQRENTREYLILNAADMWNLDS